MDYDIATSAQAYPNTVFMILSAPSSLL